MAHALLLDVDGTLFDSFPAILASMNEALGELGEPTLTDAELRPLIGMPVARQMLLLRGWEGAEVEMLRSSYYAHFEERVRTGLPLYPGVRETLEAVSPRPIGTITTRRTAVSQRMLRGADLLPYFRAVVGGDAVARPKPNPDLVLHAARAIETPVSECVAVGDAPVDIQAGRAAGATTVAALYGYGGLGALRKAQPDHEIEGFPDLSAVLEAIDGRS